MPPVIRFALAFLCCYSAVHVSAVSGQAATFDRDVMPLLTQAGCNSGACHGAATGRGGFRLSLYGQDPELDYERIVLELGGRRVNPIDPEESLLLRKAGEFIEHGGGVRLDVGSQAWDVVREWIAAGCPPPSDHAERIASIRVDPERLVASVEDQTFSVRLIGKLHNGDECDLTDRSRFDLQDTEAVSSNSPGQLKVHRPGRHVVIARVRNFVAPVEVILPVEPHRSRAPADHVSGARGNFIDDAIDRKLHDLGLIPAPAADDWTFLRRVSLALTGRLPAVDEIDRFVASKHADKRRRVVDRFLTSDAAVDYWTYWLADAMRLQNAGGTVAAATYHQWLRQQILDCRPLPEIAADVLTAEGNPRDNGAVGFYLSANDARGQAELFSEVMLGARLRCANCHDHPLDRWTQEDYHGLAAIFAGVERAPVVRFLPGRTNTHPGTGDPAMPKLPGEPFLPADQDHRNQLAEWLSETESGRQRFARAWVNRVWAALMGRGLVDPVDDHRQTNPPTHPQLLDALVADWQNHEYDLRHLVRTIVTSETYGRRGWNENGAGAPSFSSRVLAETWYACREARPLPTAVLLDAIVDVTEVRRESAVLPQAGERWTGRAVQMVDLPAMVPEAESLGTCDASGACLSTANLQQKLAILCGPLINDRVANSHSWIVRQATDRDLDAAALVDAIFLRCLNRPAKPSEKAFWVSELRSSDRSAAFQDLAWSLLNCREFTTNH